MINARIYCRSKETGQSGHASCGQWVVEIERPSQQIPEALMGWTASGDTMNQVHLEFPSQKSAVAFAKSQQWRYTITQENKRKVKPRNFSDNYVYKEVKK